MPRVIFHVDLDAFFVAVERVLDPSLLGKPVVVGGSTGSRGVVSSASYEARQYGVKSAMPVVVAKRLCPQAVVIPGKMREYQKVSRRFFEILRSCTPLVEPLSIDEAYMDMAGTERLLGSPPFAARHLRGRIGSELGVTASIGVAESRLVAKIASEECKPDGLMVVPRGAARQFLSPLHVRKLPGIGPRAEVVLKSLGIETLGQLAQHPPGPIARMIGEGQGEWLQARAQGIDDSPVVPEHEAKSMSAETTFGEDAEDLDFLRATLLRLAERVGARLRKAERHARSVSLKLRYFDFSTITRQTTLPRPVDGDGAIYAAARSLLDAALRARKTKVRLLGVGAGELSERAPQLTLLPSQDEDDHRLSAAVDAIRERFGRDAIRRAATLRLADD
ncbi:MAG: DNA polymerase IV [Chloroflexi bacterium]|nr:DNA polymerase IV [Chloroflexota bacterium]